MYQWYITNQRHDHTEYKEKREMKKDIRVVDSVEVMGGGHELADRE